MFDDSLTFLNIENLHLEYLKVSHGYKIIFKFYKDQNNFIEEKDKLLKFMIQNDKKKLSDKFQKDNNNDDVATADDIDENNEKIQIEESQTGQIIFSYNTNRGQENRVYLTFSYLSQCIDFCPNLVSLHINILNFYRLKDYKNFFEKISHLNKIRDIKLDMMHVQFDGKVMLEMIIFISTISTLQQLLIYIDFTRSNLKEWKQIFQNLMKLKQLNTLKLVSTSYFHTMNLDELLIVTNSHKKLLRLVTKDTNFYGW